MKASDACVFCLILAIVFLGRGSVTKMRDIKAQLKTYARRIAPNYGKNIPIEFIEALANKAGDLASEEIRIRNQDSINTLDT